MFLAFRCEPFSTYPRTYDLLHASYVFSHYQGHMTGGCLLEDILLEMDRIIRPQVVQNLFSFSLVSHILLVY